jgi:bifunctional non-homologous end joining protein LigD
MLKPLFEPCIPTRGTKVPDGADWIHEIKHDGYRLIVQREDKRVRLFTRNGHDWTDRFPLIVEAALRNRIGSFVIDGEAVLLGVDGRSDFNGLHSRKHNDEVQFYAFDVLSLEGEDLRPLPLHLRKASLTRLLARRVDGIFLSDFEQGEIGPDLFRHACLMGGPGFEAPRPALSKRTLAALDQRSRTEPTTLLSEPSRTPPTPSRSCPRRNPP